MELWYTYVCYFSPAGMTVTEGPATYICGECHHENDLQQKNSVKCLNCGYSILRLKGTEVILCGVVPRLSEIHSIISTGSLEKHESAANSEKTNARNDEFVQMETEIGRLHSEIRRLECELQTTEKRIRLEESINVTTGDDRLIWICEENAQRAGLTVIQYLAKSNQEYKDKLQRLIKDHKLISLDNDALKESIEFQKNIGCFFQGTDLKYGVHLTKYQLERFVRYAIDHHIMKDVCMQWIYTLLDENVIALEQIPQNKGFLKAIASQSERCEKYILRGVEKLIGAHKNTLLRKTPHVIKALYDSDIVGEKAILSWRPCDRYVSLHTSKEIIDAASPIIEWLEDASEEDD